MTSKTAWRRGEPVGPSADPKQDPPDEEQWPSIGDPQPESLATPAASSARTQKETEVASLVAILLEAPGVVFTSYRGLSVPQMQDLRSSLRDIARIRVTKNSLIELAADSLNLALPELFGPIASAFALNDFTQTVRVLDHYSATHPQLEIVGSTVAGTVLTGPQTLELARGGSEVELRARFAHDLRVVAAAPATVASAVVAKAPLLVAALSEKTRAARQPS